jgi:hypothetical protein
MFPFLSSGDAGSPPPEEVNPSLDFTATGISSGTIDISSYNFEDYHKVLQNAYTTGTRKVGGGNLITVSEYDPLNNFTPDYEDKSLLFTATDESPAISSDGWAVRAVNFASHTNPIGFTVQFPADTGLRTVKIWGMVFSNQSTNQASITAVLGDSSAPDINQFITVTGNVDNYVLFEFSYRASSTTTLNVTLTSRSTANVTRAIFYTASGVSPSVP